MTKAYSIRIYGRVFNVGFRRYVHRYGLQCHLVGYVENDHADECVHIEAEGEEAEYEVVSEEEAPEEAAEPEVTEEPVEGEEA